MSENGSSASATIAGGASKRRMLESNPWIYKLDSENTFAGSTIAVMHSRIRTDPLGVVAIEEGVAMPSSSEMVDNLGRALQRNHESLSILGTRLHRGKQTPTQLEATRLSNCLGRPLERFLAAQSSLRGKKIFDVCMD